MSQNEIESSKRSLAKALSCYLIVYCIAFIIALAVHLFNQVFVGRVSSKQYFIFAWCFAMITSTAAVIIMRRKSVVHGICAALVGVAGYTLSIYWKTQHTLCLNYIRLALVIAVVSLIFCLAVGNKTGKTNGQFFVASLDTSFRLSCVILAIVSLVACVSIPVSYRKWVSNVYLDGAPYMSADFVDEQNIENIVFEKTDYMISTVYGDECDLSNNIDRIRPIVFEDEWNELSLQQRQDTVVATVECEAYCMGIPYELEVVFTDDMDYELKGSYYYKEHTIYINNQTLVLDGNETALITLLHELRHCYQHAMCDVYVTLTPEQRNLYCFDGVDEWCENINNYVDSGDNYEDYCTQSLEDDARQYAERRMTAYVDTVVYLVNNT